MPYISLTSRGKCSAQSAPQSDAQSDTQSDEPVASASMPAMRANTTPFVELDRLTFGYGSGPAVLSNLSLAFPRGKVITIIGGSGCGKTSLLRLIGGLHGPRAGHVLIDGEPVDRSDRAGLYRMRRRMGFLLQFGALFTDLTAFENVAFPVRAHTRLPEAMVRDLVLMKLNAVGLRGAADLRIAELSGGMARRVALARAIALDPELILYDEPFAGLDLVSTGMTARLIRKLNDATGATSILVSHDVPESLDISDHVVLMAAQGRVVAQGSPEALLVSNDPEVRQLLHGGTDGPFRFHHPAPTLAADFGGAP